MSYFPMFIQLKGRRCLIVGGGRIALRKVEVLKDFGAEILVISPEILPEIQQIEGIVCREAYFERADLKGQELVVCATDDKRLNHKISKLCKEENIPVNAVDQIEDCSFIFPAYLKEGEVVAAFSSGGQCPVVTQYLKEQMRPAMTPVLGTAAEYFGSIREMVRQCIKSEDERKKFYSELLKIVLESSQVPSEDEMEMIMEKISNL